MKRNSIRHTLSETASVDYRMWGTLMLTLLFPAIYTATRIRFLGSIPTAWGYNIASQLAWVNIVYEVIHEAILLPLFHLLGKVSDEPRRLRNRTITGLIVAICIYTVLGTTVSWAAPWLVDLMAQASELTPATIWYIRYETVAKVPEIAFRMLLIGLVVQNRYRVILGLLALQMILSIGLDAFLVRVGPGSLGLGVNGIALSNVISYTALAIIAYRFGVASREPSESRGHVSRRTLSFAWLTEWTRIGGLSGIESLVRNAAFMLMILRLVNVVQEPGTFWIANSFIWGWMLLPVLSLGTLVKRDVGTEDHARRATSTNPGSYLWITLGIVAFWMLSIPLWRPFVSEVMGVENPDAIVGIAFISLPFYVAFAFNNVIDSVFYGSGRTDLMLVQAVVVNALVYGIAFILYVTGVFEPTLTRIAVLFGIGIFLDSVITFALYFLVFRKKMAAVKNAAA